MKAISRLLAVLAVLLLTGCGEKDHPVRTSLVVDTSTMTLSIGESAVRMATSKAEDAVITYTSSNPGKQIPYFIHALINIYGLSCCKDTNKRVKKQIYYVFFSSESIFYGVKYSELFLKNKHESAKNIFFLCRFMEKIYLCSSFFDNNSIFI